MSQSIKTRIKHKHDIEANWLLAVNFVPLAGELVVYDVDEEHAAPRFKIGDGKSLLSELPFSDAGLETVIRQVEDIKMKSVVATYDEETYNMTIDLSVPTQGIVEDSLESDNQYNALSAKQGKILNEKITQLQENGSGIAEEDLETILSSAKSYTDEAVAEAKNALLNGAGAAYDTLSELGTLIDNNAGALDALEIVATGKADKEHTHNSFSGATDTANGTAGMVPAPTSDNHDKYLKGDGTWSAVSSDDIVTSRHSLDNTPMAPGNNTVSMEAEINRIAESLRNLNDNAITSVSNSGKTLSFTHGDNIQMIDVSYAEATYQDSGLMSATDKAKLDGIAASADAVTCLPSLTSGTKVGTVTINGTGVDLYAPTNTDTHYTTGLVVGNSATATTNTAAAQGSVYLNVLDDDTVRNSHRILGSGNTTVTSDANGTITINTTSYAHPTYTARTGKPTANQTPAFGGTATVSQITSDATGHVTAATDRTITIPSTLSNGTGTAGLIKTTSTITSNSGYTACPVISGVPYYKGTSYTHPTTAGNKHIPSGGSSGQILRWSASGTAVWGAETDTTYTTASTSAPGLMSAADKTKLNNVTDYVVAQGTSGIWSYRKWNSGKAECWGTTSEFSTTLGSWGSVFSADNVISSVSYPFAFTAHPVVVPWVIKTGDGDFWLFTGTNNVGSASQSPTFGIARATSAVAGACKGKILLYAVGNWK